MSIMLIVSITSTTSTMSMYISNVKFSALKPGDEFNEEDVVAVDTKKNVIITKDYDNFKYYYIKDPNSKPSLYGKNLSYVF